MPPLAVSSPPQRQRGTFCAGRSRWPLAPDRGEEAYCARQRQVTSDA